MFDLLSHRRLALTAAVLALSLAFASAAGEAHACGARPKPIEAARAETVEYGAFASKEEASAFADHVSRTLPGVRSVSVNGHWVTAVFSGRASVVVFRGRTVEPRY